jgi:hypothetical protein
MFELLSVRSGALETTNATCEMSPSSSYTTKSPVNDGSGLRHFDETVLLQNHRHLLRFNAGAPVREGHADAIIGRRQRS